MWAVIRYSLNGEPSKVCEFDGWFMRRYEAELVFNEWAHEFPDEDVVLIKRSEIREHVPVPVA